MLLSAFGCACECFSCIAMEGARTSRLMPDLVYAPSCAHTRARRPPPQSFLLRHVYLDAQRSMRLSPGAAIALTFAISIVAHEAALWAGLGTVSGWRAGTLHCS